MFNKKNSKFISGKISWKDAIKEGVKILQENGKCDMGLYDAIIESTNKNGAYYVLERGLALAHAPVGEYNKKPGVSLVLLQDEIQFNGEEKYAKVIITLSAIDQTSHMEYIREFGEVFGDGNLKTKLYAANTLEEFLDNYPKKGGEDDN